MEKDITQADKEKGSGGNRRGEKKDLCSPFNTGQIYD